MSLPDPFAALRRVTAALEQLGVRYLVCGSMASSHHGEPRSTHDIDLVADLRPEDIEPLRACLGAGFHADDLAMRDAVSSRTMFNVIDRSSGIKVDVILLRDRPFSRTELARGVPMLLPDGLSVRVATAEDTLLAKLEWYRKGGEVSDRQWRDVRGIVKVQRATLDLAYVRTWARDLGVEDLLGRALGDSLPG